MSETGCTRDAPPRERLSFVRSILCREPQTSLGSVGLELAPALTEPIALALLGPLQSPIQKFQERNSHVA